jgi:hypothetical protein
MKVGADVLGVIKGRAYLLRLTMPFFQDLKIAAMCIRYLIKLLQQLT